MTRILLVATGPLPRPDAKVLTAASFRADHLRGALQRAGHRVTTSLLVPADELRSGHSDEAVRLLPLGAWKEREPWIDLLDEADAEAVVATSFHGCLAVGQLPAGLPVWCDLFGDFFAEAQVKSAATGGDSWRDDHLWPALAALGRADAFSTVSERQRLALLGQLGLAGRLDARTLGHQPAAAIPVALPHSPASPTPAPPGPPRVFLGGSFNHWIDVDLLIGVLRTLGDGPDTAGPTAGIRWVLTGGRVEGHNDRAHAAFRERLTTSGLDAKVEDHGWVAAETLSGILAGCHAGLCVDRSCAETELGSRSRIVAGLAAGLPWVATRGTELVAELEADGLVAAADRSVEAVAAALSRVLADPAGARARLAAGRDRLVERYDPDRTAAPLVAWAAAPVTAPDQPRRGGLGRLVADEVPLQGARLVEATRRADALEETLERERGEWSERLEHQRAEWSDRLAQRDLEIETAWARAEEHHREAREAWRAVEELGAEKRTELAAAWTRVEELVVAERRSRADLEGARAELDRIHGSLTWRFLRRLDRLLGRA